MRIIIINLFLLIISNSASSQWTWVNPYPQGNTILSYDLTGTKMVGGGGYSSVIVSNDYGINWFVNNKSVDVSGYITAIHCYNDNIFYAGMYSPANGKFFLKSTNGGLNWITIESNLWTYISTKDIEFLSENTGFALINSSVFKTENGGSNWQQVYGINGTLDNGSDIHFINSMTGFVSGGGGLFYADGMIKTTNGGINWNVVIPNLNGFINNIDFVDSQNGFASYSAFIFKTTNTGQTWDTLDGVLLNGTIHLDFMDIHTGYALNTSRQLNKTVDGGQSWTTIAVVPSVGKFEFINDNTGFLFTGDNVILKSTNGGYNWDSITSPTGRGSTPYIYFSSHFINENTGFTTGWGGKILKTTNKGINWNDIDYTSNSYHMADIHFLDETTGFAIRQNHYWLGNIFKTTNAGDNWVVTDSLGYDAFIDLTEIYFINITTGFILDRAGNLYKTIDAGDSWDIDQNIDSLELYNMVFFNSNTGLISGYDNPDKSYIYKTTNSGLNWNVISEFNDQGINDLFYANNSEVFAAGKGIYKSTNGGINWTQKLTGNVANEYFSKIDFSSDSIGYATGNGKIYKTTNYGENWYPQFSPYNDGLSSIHFFDNNTGLIFGRNATILRTTNGGGNFISSISQSGTYIPEGYFLNQNYPNPFNPTTNISFDIPKYEFVELKIYDIRGRLITKLIADFISPGTYNYIWDATGYSSGIYFYTLKARDFISTKKMLLLK